MRTISPAYDPRAVEAAARAIWSSRSLPPTDGPIGRGSGPVCRLVAGPVPVGPPKLATALGLARLDAETRLLLRNGQRPFGSLRPPLDAAPPDPAGPAPEDPVARLGVWLGGGALRAPAPRERELRRAMLERLASDALIVARSAPVRVCPRCRLPRSPESVIHEPEVGSAYLLRFPLRDAAAPTSLLAWVDAPWKLVATAALLVHPTLVYATVRCRRGDREERIVLLRSAVDRLRLDLPGAELEVVEETAGAALVGRSYAHPLALENPSLAELPAPAGTLVASPSVEDYGTGILPLAPAHGVEAATVGERLGIVGWPVVGTDGTMTRTVPHKYSGLPLEDAEAFILRDLIDGEALFAQHAVRKGVPRCAVCGTALLWVPARVWTIEIAKLPADRLDLFRRALPDVPVPSGELAGAWPVSGFEASEPDGGYALSECARCERLAPETATGPCACGGARHVVRRELLPEFEEAVGAWTTVESFPEGTPVRLLAPTRRRGPVLLHHLIAMQAARRRPGELRVLELPTVPDVGPALAEDEPVDALRAAVLRLGSPRAGRASLDGLRRSEAHRLRQLWQAAAELLAVLDTHREAADPGPIGPYLGELLPEDRAFLSIFERTARDVERAYGEGRVAEALERLHRFFEGELRTHRELAAPRLGPAAAPAERASALRTLAYALTRWVLLEAPAAPFTSEVLIEAFRGPGPSLFEEPTASVGRAPLDEPAEDRYRAAVEVARAVGRARRTLGIPPGTRFPELVVVLDRDEGADALRESLDVVARLAGAERVEVASPKAPWAGAQLEVRPNAAELQRAFGVQAPRILRLLQGLSPKRIQDGLKAGGVPIALEGATLELRANFFEVTESLPPRVVPMPWRGGQLLLTAPAGTAEEPPRLRPRLSLEGTRLVAAIRRRLRPLPNDQPFPEVVVRAGDPLGAELAKDANAIALSLHVPALRLAGADERLPEAETSHGRTGRGLRWSIWIAGVPRTVPAPKARRRAHARTRAPAPPGPEVVPEEQIEYLGEALRSREVGVRELIDKFEASAVGPALGPSKMAVLWELGYRTPDAIAAAPFDLVAALPGFGPVVARELVAGAGGVPPPMPPRRRAPPPEAPARVVPVEAPEPPPAAEAPLVAPDPPPAAPAPALVPSDEPSPPVAAPSVTVPAPPVPATPEPATPEPAASPPEVAVVETAAPPPAAEPVLAAEPPPTAEAPPAPEEGIRLEPSEAGGALWTRFLEATAAGHRGLCLSREAPERLRVYLGGRRVDLVWITPVGRAGAIRPSDLAGILGRIRGAIESDGVTAVFLEGLEYLVSLHSAERTLPALHELDALARAHHARIWIPVNPVLLPAPELDRLLVGLATPPPRSV